MPRTAFPLLSLQVHPYCVSHFCCSSLRGVGLQRPEDTVKNDMQANANNRTWNENPHKPPPPPSLPPSCTCHLSFLVTPKRQGQICVFLFFRFSFPHIPTQSSSALRYDPHRFPATALTLFCLFSSAEPHSCFRLATTVMFWDTFCRPKSHAASTEKKVKQTRKPPTKSHGSVLVVFESLWTTSFLSYRLARSSSPKCLTRALCKCSIGKTERHFGVHDGAILRQFCSPLHDRPDPRRKSHDSLRDNMIRVTMNRN